VVAEEGEVLDRDSKPQAPHSSRELCSSSNRARSQEHQGVLEPLRPEQHARVCVEPSSSARTAVHGRPVRQRSHVGVERRWSLAALEQHHDRAGRAVAASIDPRQELRVEHGATRGASRDRRRQGASSSMGVVDCESRIVVLDAEGASSRMVLVLRARHLVGRSGSGVDGGRMLLVGCSIGASMFVRFAIIIVIIGISIRGQGQARIDSIESTISTRSNG